MTQRRVVISQPMFFPWVGLYEQIRLADVYVHYDDVDFARQNFTNRVQVKAASGTTWLTIPIAGKRRGQPINDLKICNDEDWRRSHMGTLRACYAKAPYFRDMMDVVEDVYARPGDSLSEFVKASLMAGCRYFGFEADRQFVEVTSLDVPGRSSQRILDVTRAVGGTTYITGHGARNYLDHEAFETAGVRVEYMDYQKRPYPQLHGPFTPFVSILDLIANAGKAGADNVASGTVYWKDFANE